jgi:8-hydroxy-5-deazaflavin:NADPH oxidoreductase
VRAADVVINATPGTASVDVVSQIGDAAFANKVLLDIANAPTPAFELAYPNSSLGQALQEALPSAKVVKTLNTLEAPLMVNPSAIGPSTVFLSGDDAEAETTATQLLADLGWADDAIVDLGGIASARGPEHYFLLFAALWQALGTATFNDGDDQEKLGRLCPIRKAWLSGLEAASLVSRTTCRLR